MNHEDLLNFKTKIINNAASENMYPAQSVEFLEGIFIILCEILNELQNQRRSPFDQKDL